MDVSDLRKYLQTCERDRCHEDYPHQTDELRRNIIIEAVVSTGDILLMAGIDGVMNSAEELNYLTSAIALKWMEKTHMANQSQMLARQLQGEANEARRNVPRGES